MARPVVDIILPTNRASRFLTETLASVAAQTWTNWTLTIVDDGVPEPSVLAYAASQMPSTYVIKHPSSGVSAARNLGIKSTQGDFLVFLDDDDVWHPTRLEEQVSILEVDPHYLGAFCGGEYIDSDGVVFGRGWPASQVPSRRFLAGEFPLPRIVTMMVRRDACLAIQGFNENLRVGEDLDFTLRLLRLGELLAVSKPLVQYRRHENNISQVSSRDERAQVLKMLAGQVRDVEGVGDASLSLLLAENLRRRKARIATEAVNGLSHAIKTRTGRDVLIELAWMARTPQLTTRALVGWCQGYWVRRKDRRDG